MFVYFALAIVIVNHLVAAVLMFLCTEKLWALNMLQLR